jgi:glycine/serine hydroxymethyltransferase
VADCEALAHIICDVLDKVNDPATEHQAKDAALDLCRRHPVYSNQFHAVTGP